MSKLTLSFKGKMLKVYQVNTGEMVIGSAPGCAVHIDSLALQPQHATITTQKDVSRLHVLGSGEEVLVNDTPMREHILRDNDQIQIGKYTLLYSFVATTGENGEDSFKSATEAASKSAWLQILNGSNVGKTINLKGNMTNLGKAGVQTAVITRRGGGYFITHLEGQHSPTVDGKPIGDASQPLLDGCIIQLGNVKMQFTLV